MSVLLKQWRMGHQLHGLHTIHKKSIADAFIIDGAALINEKSQGTVRAFDEHA